MRGFISGSLLNKLIALFLLVSLAPIAVVGLVSYIRAQKAMERQFLGHFTSVAESSEKAISLMLEMRMEQVEILATNEIVQNLVDIWNQGQGAEELYAETLDSEARNFIEVELPKFSNITPFYEYTFIGRTGKVYFSTDESLVGQDFSQHEAFTRGIDKTFVTDIRNDEATGKPSFAVVAPIHQRASRQDAAIGVIVAKMHTDALSDICTQVAGLGEAGEVYVVNREGKMITPSAFEDGAVLQREVNTKPFQHFNTTQSAKHSGLYDNYLGKPIVGVATGDKLNEQFGLGWLVLAEIDIQEAFRPARNLGYTLFGIAVVIGFVVFLFAYAMAKRIAHPIEHISTLITRVSEGDLSVDVPTDYPSDEVGQLAESFRVMVQQNRKLTRQIKKGVKVLASSASEISSTTSQLASIATETAAAVTETATTVEEIKQTAQVASETAQQVSDSQQTTVQISQQGKSATEDTVVGMTRIKSQMDSVAESIIRLNEQSQTIGEIISTVDDLAEQSNLLAVNAAIEAAKAGEHGKGFAVVATEIKNLAMQSKQATEQVRTILNDIQKATGAAVNAAEQGSSAVESGVDQSGQAGEAIVALASAIDDGAQVAMEIAASSREQLVGMGQVAAAMESINEASGQNVKSVKILEVSARKLHDLGQKLMELVERYQV